MLLTDIFHMDNVDKINPGTWVISDMNGVYEVFGKIGDNIFAKSHRTGQIIRVVQTGQVMRDGWYRARFEFATDINDEAGHIGFTKDHKIGGNVGQGFTKI